MSNVNDAYEENYWPILRENGILKQRIKDLEEQVSKLEEELNDCRETLRSYY